MSAAIAKALDDGPTPNNLPSTTAFLDVSVVPMDRERVLANQTVIVEGGRLTRVGPSKAIAIPTGARRIEANKMYLIPGLVDAHLHLQSQIEFPPFLANGVTTVFNLDGRPAHLLWRRQVANGELTGAYNFQHWPYLPPGANFRGRREAGR